MSRSTDLEAPVAHVVHLVPDLDSPTAPEALGFPPPYSPAARRLVLLPLLAGTGLAIWMLVSLWTGETPGLWFQLLFTVFIGGAATAGWAVAAGARSTGRERAAAVAAWAAVRDRAVPAPGRIVDRQVSLASEGDVSGFVLGVDAGGERLLAAWTPHPRRGAYLLQPQIPGIGAAVRVWSVPGVAGAPLVVEAVDPTRVP